KMAGRKYGDIVEPLEAGVKAMAGPEASGSDGWITELAKTAISKTKGPRGWINKDVKDIVDAGIRKNIEKAFKSVDILNGAKVGGLVDGIVANISKGITDGMGETELKVLMKKEIEGATEGIEAAMRNEIVDAMQKQAIANVLKNNPGIKTLTPKLRDMVARELEYLGLPDAKKLIVAEQLLTDGLAAQAKNVANKPSGSLFVKSWDRTKTSFISDKELAGINSWKINETLVQRFMNVSWAAAKAPYHLTRTAAAGLLVDVPVVAGKFTYKKILIPTGKRIAYTDLAYAVPARGAYHWGANAILNREDRRKAIPIKYMQTLPGEAFDALFRQAYGKLQDGEIYAKIDGRETRLITRENGKYTTDKPIEGLAGFGRHQVEMSIRNTEGAGIWKATRKMDLDRVIERKIVLVEVSPPLYDYGAESKAVTIYAPNGARLADQELVLTTADAKRKYFCKTDNNGKLLLGKMDKAGKAKYGENAFAPEEGVQYLVFSKRRMQLGDFTLSGGNLLSNQSVSASQGGAQQEVASAEITQAIRPNQQGALLFEDPARAKNISLVAGGFGSEVKLYEGSPDGNPVAIDIAKLAKVPKNDSGEWEIIYQGGGMTSKTILLPSTEEIAFQSEGKINIQFEKELYIRKITNGEHEGDSPGKQLVQTMPPGVYIYEL
ncbi:MAG: hypothetical protein WC263_01770, partial [Candidatus Micrarchaeia archaeon]